MEPFEERLADEVRRYKHLYDPSSKHYKKSEVTMTAWMKIGKTLGEDTGVCMRKWKTMRDKFVRQRKRMKAKKRGDPGAPPPACYSVLSWLDDFIKHRETETSASNYYFVRGTYKHRVPRPDAQSQCLGGARRPRRRSQAPPTRPRRFDVTAKAGQVESDDGTPVPSSEEEPHLDSPMATGHRSLTAGLNLPMSSMRLLVPPVRLMSAYMWQVAQQRCVDQYGKLAEFISLVTQMVPELLSFRQRAQLILGLRARLTLELFQSGETCDPQTIEDHLNTVRLWTTNSMEEEQGQDDEVDISKLKFVELVQTLLHNPSERKCFFKDVFPVQYGARFDTTLQILVWEFLSRLEEFLPVPSFSQVDSSSYLAALDSDQVEQFFSDPEDLKMLLENQKHHKKLKKAQLFFKPDCILSTLASKLTPVVFHDGDEHPGEKRGGLGNQEMSETSLQRNGEKEERKMSHQENKLSEGDTHEEEEEGADEGSNEAVGSNFQQQQEEEPSPLRAPLSSPETDTEMPVDLLFLENNCLEVPVNNERKVKCHLRRKDRNPGVERIQGSTGDGAEDLLPSSRPNSCSTKITKKHSCPQCGKTFRRRCDMKRHRDVHILPRLFKCDQCEKRFKTEAHRKHHLQVHTGHKHYICSYCGKGLMYKQTLKIHLRTHTGERPYACTLCEKKFTQINILKVHLRMHKGDRPFLCSDCGKAFCDSGALLIHSRQHTGERPYHCDVCGKGYITLQRLKLHQRFHTGERPYPCPDCKKCFRAQSGLTKHIRTHTGEKPFQCPKCDHRCSQRSNLKIHMRTHKPLSHMH